MNHPKRLSGPERRVQLMKVGRELFASNGYETTSIEEVARKAGVTKPIVYEHFGSKEGLHAAIVEREMDDLVARVTGNISAGTPRERFNGAVLAFMTWASEEPAGFLVLSRDSPTAVGRRGLTRVIDDLANRVGDLFTSEFESAGYTRKVAQIYANALVGMVTQVVQWWSTEKRPASVEEVARHVSALGWMGLRHLPKDEVPASTAKRPAARKAPRAKVR